MSDPLHGVRELFKDYLKERGVTEAPENLLKKEVVAVMSKQDFAEKLATELNNFIMEYGDLSSLSIGDEIKDKLSEAIKQAREIGRLESNKAIEWPTEIPEERFIDVRDERGELVRFIDYEWFKQSIGALSE